MLLRVAVPRWVVVFWTVCAAPCAAVLLLAWMDFARVPRTARELAACISVTTVIALILFPGGFVYGIVVATERGIEVRAAFRRKRRIAWCDIASVRRPRLGIPYDAAHVDSRDGTRILLTRSMQGYPELIDLIRSKAPHATVGDVLPHPPSLGRLLWYTAAFAGVLALLVWVLDRR